MITKTVHDQPPAYLQPKCIIATPYGTAMDTGQSLVDAYTRDAYGLGDCAAQGFALWLWATGKPYPAAPPPKQP